MTGLESTEGLHWVDCGNCDIHSKSALLGFALVHIMH
jgi:hypothetical protein